MIPNAGAAGRPGQERLGRANGLDLESAGDGRQWSEEGLADETVEMPLYNSPRSLAVRGR